MEGVFLERKCRYFGMWKDDIVADNIIRQVANMVRDKKGTKCKLNLSSAGMKVTTSSIMSGTVLKDHEPFGNIYFVTVNQYNPQCLLFIMKDERRKYRIAAIRCATAADAGLFVSCYKDLRRALKLNENGNNFELKQIESGNWTLRAKTSTTEKRQLNTIVDMNAAKMTVHTKQNGVIETGSTDINSNMDISVESSASENNNNVNKTSEKDEGQVEQREGNSVAIQAELSEGNEISVSESGLKDDLDHLSNELREIKFQLETSTGIGADVYHDKDKKEVEIEQTANKSEIEIVAELGEQISPIEVVVEDNDSSDNENKENSDKVMGNGNILNNSQTKESENSNESEVKVVVPDYRSSGTQTAPKYVRRYVPKENHTTVFTNDNTEPISPRSTTSYEAWKDDVVLRKKVVPAVIRPRSAYLSTSSTGSSLQGSLRDRNPHIIYATTSRTHHTLPHHSLRVPMRRSMNVSSTIERPIEKVYPRPRSVHGGSIVYRSLGKSQRETIYTLPRAQKRIYVDKNEIRKSGNVTVSKKDGNVDTVIIKT